MVDVAIFVPEPAVGMSAALIADLCWVAAVDAGRDPAEAIQVVSLDGGPVTTHTGLSVSVNSSIADIDSASLLFLSAFWGSSGDALTRNHDVLLWIENLATRGARIAACSTGSFLLAATGLLDGRVATTYAPYAHTFRRRFPAVEFHGDRSITDAGGLMCADAIPSSLDLIIASLGDLYGTDIAEKLATDFLMGIRRSYTIANLAFDGQKFHGDRQVLAVQRDRPPPRRSPTLEIPTAPVKDTGDRGRVPRLVIPRLGWQTSWDGGFRCLGSCEHSFRSRATERGGGSWLGVGWTKGSIDSTSTT